ncbi:Nucleolar GTP-binding protein 2 [Hondaea fermentalgiana]|uniref:Nucleolar GTP-binding protein 2 n=1 Tax=Hondaea fermentalgiana TaxID=2315210 RepID=A0A2R5G7E1_9STRA|nr:Nucleolar GTP-binding protein 2 [Hondaea fermentalgiana]|eukprot:GBG25708.1 Nucleolar GTP-binding protein 2 [Hondaea fermentalgiana]
MPHVRRHGGKSQSSSNPDRKDNGKGNMRSKATIKRLNMYKSGAPIRNRQGKIVGGEFMSNNRTGNRPMEKMSRIAPNRRWFGNTRVVGQKELEAFREQMAEKVADPYTVVLNQRRLPMSLLTDSKKEARMHLLSSESYESVFGPKRQRKRAKLSASSLDGLAQQAQKKSATFEAAEEEAIERNGGEPLDSRGGTISLREKVFEKGQSKRIWQELYKVLDCSDVVIQVLDVRDPMGTRSKRVEEYLRKEKSHKHLIFVLNKVDLVPTWVTRRWVRLLSEEYPTLAFHANMTKPFGKGALIQLLRQFALLHPEKKQISVGFIGYPNAGKSSIINTLRSKKVCKVAPIPGETKIWQYITLFKRVFLIDCPGVVYPNDDSEAEVVFKGVVRAERLESPDDYVPFLLDRVQPEYVRRTYGIDSWVDAEDFLSQLAFKRGRLLKKGEPDIRSVAQRVIYDLQRGRIPYFVPPASSGDDDDGELDEAAAQKQDAAAARAQRAAKAKKAASSQDEGDDDDNEDEEDADNNKNLKRLEVPMQNFALLPQKQFGLLTEEDNEEEAEADDDQVEEDDGEGIDEDEDLDDEEADADDEEKNGSDEGAPSESKTPKGKSGKSKAASSSNSKKRRRNGNNRNINVSKNVKKSRMNAAMSAIKNQKKPKASVGGWDDLDK